MILGEFLVELELHSFPCSKMNSGTGLVCKILIISMIFKLKFIILFNNLLENIHDRRRHSTATTQNRRNARARARGKKIN